MARRPVVLGWPISLALRGISGMAGLGGGASLGALAGAGAIVGAVSATVALTSVAPWVSSQASSLATQVMGASTGTTAGAGDIISMTDMIGGLLTFLDMNAEMITITEKRRIAVVSVPGRESDFLQDLGGHTVRYAVRGKFFDTDPQYLSHRGIMQTLMKTIIGSAAVGSTQMLRLLMRTASPVPFISEHEITFAIITDFRFSQVGGEPNWVNYEMNLMEYGRIPYLAKMALLGASNAISRKFG